jgi:hypothetical protein
MNHKSELTYRRVEGLDFTEVPDGFVVYDEGRERVLYLNRTAAAVLELCEEALDAENIAKMLQETFDLPEKPLKDVESCLRLLVAEELIRAYDTQKGLGFLSGFWRRITNGA